VATALQQQWFLLRQRTTYWLALPKFDEISYSI